MCDRHVHDAIASQPEQCRDEPMKPTVERQSTQALTTEGAKGTAAVFDALIAHPVTNAVAHSRRHAPDEGIAIPTVHSLAADRVPLIERGGQARDVGGVVLQVGVHGHDHPPTRGLEARVGGRRLAGVRLESDESDTSIALAEATDDLGAPVLAAVVDEDDLELDAQSFEHRAELDPQWRGILLLVVHRDDDRETDHQVHDYTPTPSTNGRAVISRYRRVVWSSRLSRRGRTVGSRGIPTMSMSRPRTLIRSSTRTAIGAVFWTNAQPRGASMRTTGCRASRTKSLNSSGVRNWRTGRAT